LYTSLAESQIFNNLGVSLYVIASGDIILLKKNLTESGFFNHIAHMISFIHSHLGNSVAFDFAKSSTS